MAGLSGNGTGRCWPSGRRCGLLRHFFPVPPVAGGAGDNGSGAGLGRIAAEVLQFVTESLPGSTDFVASNVRQIVRYRGALGIVATIGLLWSGRAVFAAAGRA